MLRKTKQWDIRCPEELVALFPRRTGWWFKVNREQARAICAALAKAYEVAPPIVDEVTPHGWNGQYDPRTGTISIWNRAHVKSIFHEFYHHLDYSTNGKYNSADRRGGPSSLAWQFADRLFAALQAPVQDR